MLNHFSELKRSSCFNRIFARFSTPNLTLFLYVQPPFFYE